MGSKESNQTKISLDSSFELSASRHSPEYCWPFFHKNQGKDLLSGAVLNGPKVERSGSVGRALDWGLKGC